MHVEGTCPKFDALKNEFDLVIYHKNCNDGIAAYAVVRKYYLDKFAKEIEGIACAYGDPVPDYTERSVLVVDFSFPMETIVAMQTNCKSFFLLDHHVSAERELGGTKGCCFDMSRSGAMLAWDFFFTGLPPPKIVKYVQDKDLWRWKLPHSREFNVSMELLPFDPSLWVSLLENDDRVDKMVEEGIVLSGYKTSIAEKIASELELFHWEPFTREEHQAMLTGLPDPPVYYVGIVNSGTFVNEVGEMVCKSHRCDIALMYTYSSKKRSLRFAMRSNSVDVSVIAKKLGGGGHAGAAGFNFSGSMNRFLRTHGFEEI